MKISFDAASDFNAEYALPGYGCVVKVNVIDGIVNLSIEDDEDEIYNEDLDGIDDYRDMLYDEYEMPEIEEIENVSKNFDDSDDCEEEYEDNERDFTLTDETASVDEPKVWASGFIQICNEKENCHNAIEATATTENYDAKEEEKTESLEYKLAEMIDKIDKDGKVLEMFENLLNSYKVQKATAKATELFEKFAKTFKDIAKSQD